MFVLEVMRGEGVEGWMWGRLVCCKKRMWFVVRRFCEGEEYFLVIFLVLGVRGVLEEGIESKYFRCYGSGGLAVFIFI